MNRLGLGLSELQVKQCIEVLDTDGDGEVSLHEFMALVAKPVKAATKAVGAARAFAEAGAAAAGEASPQAGAEDGGAAEDRVDEIYQHIRQNLDEHSAATSQEAARGEESGALRRRLKAREQEVSTVREELEALKAQNKRTQVRPNPFLSPSPLRSRIVAWLQEELATVGLVGKQKLQAERDAHRATKAEAEAASRRRHQEKDGARPPPRVRSNTCPCCLRCRCNDPRRCNTCVVRRRRRLGTRSAVHTRRSSRRRPQPKPGWRRSWKRKRQHMMRRGRR